MNQKIAVQLNFDEQVFGGEFDALQIVHEALTELLPANAMARQKVKITAQNGDLIYPDMFLGEIFNHYGSCVLDIAMTQLEVVQRAWRHVGFDHLALTVSDRAKAVDFFHRGLKMKVIRDDEHISVVTTGNTSLFFFDAEPEKPLTDGVPSRIHHIGFVVDDMEAAYSHLQQEFPEWASDFSILERMERYSMYGRFTVGDMTFLIQLSEIKPAFRSFDNPFEFTDIMYDYRARPYGIRFERD